jgi:hypothetical protein
MKLPVPRRRPLGLLFAPIFLLIAALAPRPAAAFPPAPHYTIFGVVRDQVGTTLNVQGAVIILLKDNVEIGRAPIAGSLLDQNYELDIRIDQVRPSSRVYSSRAVAAQGLYSLVVEMNGERFYPIEVAGTLRAGNGGERVRLDLNLGADANHDGLPDVWQEWQLYQAGRVPGTAGWSIDLLTRDGDFDGDGVSNYLEYLAGTFAGDATERFELKITGKTATTLSFEFFGITGKVYGLEQSTDLVVWAPAAFALTPGGATQQFFRAPDVNLRAIHVPALADVARFYRLTVR